MNECAYSKKPIQKSTHKNMHLKKKKKGNTNTLQLQESDNLTLHTHNCYQNFAALFYNSHKHCEQSI